MHTPTDTSGSPRATLVVAILGSSLVFLDATVATVALPAIGADLGAGLAGQQWVVFAFLLTLGALLLPGGALGDRLGRRRVFAAGIAGFGVASVVCALAPSTGVLIAGRAAQGTAGALLVPATLALLMSAYDEGGRGAAIGSWTAWTGVATMIAPFAGGLLVDEASWRWIFALNVPVVAVTLVLLRRVRADRPVVRGSLDVAGALLVSGGLAGIVFGLSRAPAEGWGEAGVVAALGAGSLALVAFVGWERRAATPMLPLGLFSGREFTVGNLVTVLLYGALAAAYYLVVVFLQQSVGYSALQAGLALLPMTAVIFALSKRFGMLSDRFGTRPLLIAGPVVTGLGLLLLAFAGASPSYAADLLPGVLLFGLGLAVCVAALTATVLGAVDPASAGVASGVNNAASRVAGLVVIALVGVVVATVFSSQLRADAGGRSAALARALVDAESRPLVVVPAGGLDENDTRTARAELSSASAGAFAAGIGLCGLLALAAGVVAFAGLRSKRAASVAAADCPGGALVGAARVARPLPAPV